MQWPLRLAVLAVSAEAARRVRWYVAAGRADDNEAFMDKYASSMTGIYGCCNLLQVAANGSVVSKPELASWAQPALARGLTYHAVASVNGDGIMTGDAKAAAAEVVRIVSQAKLTGIIFDYEPSSNYTKEHEGAYMSFLKAIKDEAGSAFEVGMDVAGWGILKDLPAYVPAHLDLYTSMTPTYVQQSALSPTGLQFVQDMVSNFGSDRAAVGVGSVPEPGFEKNCANMPNYNWTSETLSNFATKAAGFHIEDIDVWRCDIDNYGETPQWFFDSLTAFLQGGSLDGSLVTV